MPDSVISGQDAATAAGLGADGQEAGRVNGLMSTLGTRTAERDAALAERDRLREELAAYQAAEPVGEAPGAEPQGAQLPDSTAVPDQALSGPEGDVEPASVPDVEPAFELPYGTEVRTPDGGYWIAGVSGPSTIAPTTPRRPSARPLTQGSVEELRQRFAAQLPGYAAEVQERALLRGH